MWTLLLSVPMIIDIGGSTYCNMDTISGQYTQFATQMTKLQERFPFCRDWEGGPETFQYKFHRGI